MVDHGILGKTVFIHMHAIKINEKKLEVKIIFKIQWVRVFLVTWGKKYGVGTVSGVSEISLFVSRKKSTPHGSSQILRFITLK